MNRIIVTGCAGFIGSHVCEQLLKDEQNQILGIDIFNEYYSPQIKENNILSFKNNLRFTLQRTDITKSDEVDTVIKTFKPGVLIHCAAMAGVRYSIKHPLIYTETNILGTQNILESIKNNHLDTKLVLLSSSSVYGVQDTTPFVETMQPNPTSPYGATKLSMEILSREYHNHYGLRIAIVRPFSIYGPRGRVDMAPFLILKAATQNKPFYQFGSNDNKRDWTYVADFASGVVKLVDNWDFSSFEIFNLGNSHPVGLVDFIQLSKRLLKEKLGLDLQVIKTERGKEELPITYADINKAQEAFGYNPKTSLDQGLEYFYEYYLKNKEIYEFNH